MTPGMPAPSGYNLPYGVSLRDLEPPEPTCDKCDERLAEDEYNNGTLLCNLCRTEGNEQ